jgi:hypothetical protein
MPLVRMPNGQYVRVADGTPPDVVARIREQYPAKAQSAAPAQPSAVDSRRAQVDSIVQERKQRKKSPFKVTQGFDDALRGGNENIMSNLTWGLTDAADAGVNAAKQAFKGKNFREQYNLYKDAIDQERASFTQENPILGGVTTAAGMLLNPLGASTGIGKLAAKIAPKLVNPMVASKVGQAIGKVGNSTIGVGARAGFNQGVISGAVDSIGSPENVVSNTLNQGGISALFGAGGGALIGGAGKVGQIITDRMPENAVRVAYSKMAELLDKSINPATKKPFTPLEAVNEMKVHTKAGNDPMLMDISQNMRDTGAYIANNPKSDMASEMSLRGEDRLTASPDRFNAKVRKTLGDANAFERKKQIRGDLKEENAIGYSKEVMEKPFSWTFELGEYFKKNNPTVQDAVRRAEKLVRSEDRNPTQLGFQLNKDGEMEFVGTPNMYVFDKIRKGFNEAIGEAMRSGNKETAKMYSQQRVLLTDEIAKVNPIHTNSLKAQRDLYQQEESVEVGENFIKLLRENPRKLFDDIRKPEVKQEDLRLGVADAFLRLHEKGDNPVKILRADMRSKEQRMVLAHVFKSNKKLNEFDGFMRNEIRQRETDQMLSTRARNRADLLRDNPDQDAAQGVVDVGKAAAQGLAFGGPIGAASRAVRSLDMLSRRMGPDAERELAKTLIGRGEGLVKGVGTAKKYAKQRAEREKARAMLAGKLAGGSTTGIAEE